MVRDYAEFIRCSSTDASAINDVDETVMELGDELDDLYDAISELEDEDVDFEDEDGDEDLYEITCPECDEKLFLDYEELCECPSLSCPACGADIAIDVPCTGDCESCGDCDCE